MQLQEVFYIVSIIYMILLIAVMVGITILLLSIKRTIDRVNKTVNDKIDAFQKMTAQPQDLAMSVGAAVANSAIRKVKKLMQR